MNLTNIFVSFWLSVYRLTENLSSWFKKIMVKKFQESCIVQVNRYKSLDVFFNFFLNFRPVYRR